MGQTQANGISLEGASWSAWASWAEESISVLYDYNSMFAALINAPSKTLMELSSFRCCTACSLQLGVSMQLFYRVLHVFL